MNFKDALAFEAEHVFMNTDEFADHISVNGSSVCAVWGDSRQPLGEKSSTDPTGWGVASQTSVLLVLEKDFACPLPDEALDINGEIYTVVTVRPQMGIIRLELERNTA